MISGEWGRRSNRPHGPASWPQHRSAASSIRRERAKELGLRTASRAIGCLTWGWFASLRTEDLEFTARPSSGDLAIVRPRPGQGLTEESTGHASRAHAWPWDLRPTPRTVPE